MSAPLTALGVDVSVARGLDLILLDARRGIVDQRRKQTPADLGAYLAQHRPDVVAIDSPPMFGSSGGSRLVERELMQRGVHVYGTPSANTERAFYGWMRVGHQAFAAAAASAYPLYVGGQSIAGSAIEVFPHATAVALKGSLPPKGWAKRTSTRRSWRAQVLEAHGVQTASLKSLDEIDAALGALTGLLALEGSFCALGDEAEGLIILPCRTLRARYVREIASPPCDPSGLLERAIALAIKTHEGQKDKGGHVYIRHPLRVMERVSAQGLETMIVAVLHDGIEDGILTVEQLCSMGFPADVVEAISLVTKRAEEKGSDAGYEAFIRRIAVSGSQMAIAVKLADLADNSDLSRLGREPTPEDRARVEKYELARRLLEEAAE